MHDQACIIQCFLDVVKDDFPNAMLFQKVSELQQGGGVRNRFRHEVQTHKFPHTIAVIDGIFDTSIGKVKPDLQEIHPKHRLDPSGWPPTFARWIIWGDYGNPPIPRNDLIHSIEKRFSWCGMLPVLVFNIAECGLVLHQIASLLVGCIQYNIVL